MGYFNSREVQAIRGYKYNGRDDSLIIKYVYRRFWDYVVTFFPEWLAPNVITFAGFWFEVVSFVISFVVSEGLKKPLPSWCCFLNGISLCIYVQLDNLDGRQARRTGSSSALGQFFDHGCDAITGVSELCKAAATFGLNPRDAFFVVFLMGIGFFMTSWEEYVTHAFYLGYLNGPDEGLTLLYIGYILVGFVPDLRTFIVSNVGRYGFLVGVIVTVAGNIVNVVLKANRDKPTFLRCFVGVIPCCISVALSISLITVRPENVEDPFFIMTSGYVLQFLAQHVIVGFLAKRTPWHLFDWRVLILWTIEIAALVQPQISAHEYFWASVCGVAVFFMVVFDVLVVRGMCDALGIYAFKLKKKAA